mmetsp:Transcript_17107/g.49106  ORF Transcript_17107/g.49106 Transcript_17107/m.49106 type:complete len:352 (-) Transcript_17107:51-1106(-)
MEPPEKECELVPLAQFLESSHASDVPLHQGPSAKTSNKVRPHRSWCRRTFVCLSHAALAAVILAILLVLVAIRDASVGERVAEGGDSKLEKDSEDFQGAHPNVTIQEPPLILDAALGLVPPQPPAGKTQLPLEFIHATKTGGSAVEKAAAKHGIAWGACHYNSASFNDMNCPSRSPPQYFEGRVKATRYIGSMLWHIPPQYWSPNLLEGHKTFTIIRNPYSRAVSEYYNKWDGYVGPDITRNDPANMNAWIQTNLIDRPKGIRYLPHSKYVYDDNDNQVVDVVLHFENLTAEFNELMESEGLPIRLDDTPFNERTGTALLGVKHLTNSTIRKINDFCLDDFLHFDYEPMLL